MNPYLSLGVGVFHYTEEPLDLGGGRWGKVGYFDVMQLQIGTRVVVGWFSFTQTNQVFDPIVQQVLVF